MLQVCLNEVRSLICADLLLLLKYDPARSDHVVLLDFLSAEPALLAKDGHFAIPEGSTLDKVLRQQSTIEMASAAFLADEHGFDLLPQQKAYTGVAVALKMQGAVNGLLILLHREPLEIDPIRGFLERVARCLALAIERNRLHNAVARRNRELESIKQIGSALASSTFDIKQVLNYTMDMIRLIMNVETGALYLLDDISLTFAVSFNTDARQRKPVKLRLGQGIPGYVAARGEVMMINESHGGNLFTPEIRDSEEFPIRSALCVPMISQGRVIGVIEVLNKKNGEFVHGDQDLLQSIASSVSIAIENANLYKETVAMAENERGIRRIFQKFVPKEILEKILHGSAGSLEMAEELKTLTLLNIDIRGFSGLVKALGPQKSVALLNAFFSLMGGVVFKHHGIVDKYLGDGFLAIFGAPVSSVADADHAVSAALEMQRSLEKINAGLAKEMGISLKIGISIHTGEVVVGNIGFDMKMDYTVIGDPVNDVFRLQDKVRPFPDAVLLSEKTLRATRLPVKYLELEERLGQLKIYELLGVS
ncbi:MAG: adenylate/guanylate cyclase domain-containing protein [Desulfosarcinaceae bacterium]